MMEMIVASHNQHKIKEIKYILKDARVRIYSLGDVNRDLPIKEDGLTYYENAQQKAKVIVDSFGKMAMGEDSGLEVDALAGQPGIYSARYAGENASPKANNDKLLEELKDIPFHLRTARYRCTLVLLFPSGKSYSWVGICEGMIAFEAKGESGFGYDPLFFLPEYQKTFAELGDEIKNRISHRAKALDQLKKFFENWEKPF